ncbi:MAG TPA: hypothetical protein VGF75_01725 [Candidatus Saccharimonadales bacterium]|jgi:DNA polymerase-3 subunit delta'
MKDQPINPKTTRALKDYRANPGQAVALIGQKWLNKGLIARVLSEELLDLKPGNLKNYPYYLATNIDGSSVTIDEIRAVNDFLILTVPVSKQVNRVVVIEAAERMTLEAQNALLKNLEEPPIGTVFILTLSSANLLLPTIISRLHRINVYKPEKDQLVSYYRDLGHDPKDINQALLISDGLPGLMDLLLSEASNPISKATDQAKKLLGSTTFERLSYINELSKDKNELKNLLFVIKQMAKIGVATADPRSSVRWQKILGATLESEQNLQSNVQLKLLLTNYMLSLS